MFRVDFRHKPSDQYLFSSPAPYEAVKRIFDMLEDCSFKLIIDLTTCNIVARQGR